MPIWPAPINPYLIFFIEALNVSSCDFEIKGVLDGRIFLMNLSTSLVFVDGARQFFQGFSQPFLETLAMIILLQDLHGSTGQATMLGFFLKAGGVLGIPLMFYIAKFKFNLICIKQLISPMTCFAINIFIPSPRFSFSKNSFIKSASLAF